MRYFILLVIACALAADCGNPLGLQAFLSNDTATVSLYALSGTPIDKPSGFLIYGSRPQRTDQTTQFDFAFDFDSAGNAVLLPTGALKMGVGSGLQISGLDFDSLTIAPTTGYQKDSALVVTENSVVIAQSAPANALSCTFGLSYPLYAKLHILTIDTTSGPNGRRIDFLVLANGNCGFRGLELGLPRR